MKYRKTEMFLFFCIFGDRDEDSIVGIKKERKTLISCHLVTLGQVLGCRSAMHDGPERPIMKSDSFDVVRTISKLLGCIFIMILGYKT